mgnify:CR=1 FL=1
MAITQGTIERIKAAPLSKVIEGLGASLKKVGREFVTQCIWHEDTNPSLTINDEKGFCFCHVCRQGGDAIAYTRQRKGVEFFDAVNLSAEILGVKVETDGVSPEEQERRSREKRRILEGLEKEQAVYRANLKDPRAGRIRGILADRGIEPRTSREFGIGYSSQGFFEGRITIPIYNHLSKLVGWTGRTTTDDTAKYKNSMDRPGIFEKKFLVFNEARAREAARLTGSLILVEGHMDVISLWQHGIENVIAMQGTGVPEKDVIIRLIRNIKTLILCFDGDSGGQKAVQTFIGAVGPHAKKGEVQINVATLPAGKDPDEVCREGGAMAFHALTSGATPWLDWVIDFYAADLDKEDGRAVTSVENALRQEIDTLQSKALRAHYIDKVARCISRNEKEAAKVAKEWGEVSVKTTERSWTPRSEVRTRTATERRMLRIFVHRPEHRDRLRPLLGNVSDPPLQWLRDRLVELEDHCAVDLTPHSVMAVVAASEPHFMQQLRTIVQPNVTIDDSKGVLKHITDIMGEGIPESDEPNTDQSFA